MSNKWAGGDRCEQEEEVKEVLRNGSDEVHNSLIIDFDGTVSLVPFESKRKGYAVRFETFVAGNGYVGSKSALNHLDGTYQAMLEAWVDHLKYGGELYKDYSEHKKSIDELQSEATELTKSKS